VIEIRTRIWDLVARFFAAKSTFRSQRENYERIVGNYAKKRSVDRRDLHLTTHEIAGLLDFKALEDLRDNHLWELKQMSHSIFRTDDKTDIFDKYISDIYHEVSILKEEHYTVMTYAPAYEEGLHLDLAERDKILEEVHQLFPRKMEQIRSLFVKAYSRLQELLKLFLDERIFVRSLYLFGNDVLGKAGEGDIAALYEKIYPKGGAVQGYLKVAQSFHESGFYENAEEALKKAKSALRKSKLPDTEKKKKREEINQLAKLTIAALAKMQVL